jgi:type VI secretion system protein VasG
MAEIKRSILFGKLNPMAYKALESAFDFCKMRGNPYLELLHWFFQIFQLNDSDQHRLLRHFQLDAFRVARDLMAALDRLPRGATSISDLSPHLEESVERGWVYGSLLFGEDRVRTGHVTVGILKTPRLRSALLEVSDEFQKIKPDELTDGFHKILAGSPEESAGAAPGKTSSAIAPAASVNRKRSRASRSTSRKSAPRRNRPNARPRRRNPADRGHPDALPSN